MKASLANRVHFGSRIVSRNPVGVPAPRWAAVSFRWRRFRESRPSLEVSCSYESVPVSTLETGRCFGSFDEALALQTKSQEIEPYLSGRCIYLVGLMGSGKTTVGKIIAQVLNYSFSDSDKLIEKSVDGVSVAEIFKLYGEPFFREKEELQAMSSWLKSIAATCLAKKSNACDYVLVFQTEALKKLSVMQWVVVSTGGGAVVWPVNWRYMQKGISVWLDVPLEALAQRIAAEGTESRPILHQEPGDPYTKALKRLSTLLEERYDCYANADARVSLLNIAAKQGYRDVSSISPTAIALEALEEIGHYLRRDDMLCL